MRCNYDTLKKYHQYKLHYAMNCIAKYCIFAVKFMIL